MWHGEFRHPRAVQVYDAAFGWTRADERFLAVAGEVPGGRVLDLGCGTGRLALAPADAGHRVTGVDPALARPWTSRAQSAAPTASRGSRARRRCCPTRRSTWRS